MTTSKNTANDSSTKPRSAARTRWPARFLCATALIVAFGLGAKVLTGGTGIRVEFGAIDAFGSIVVNGIHYDETAANIIIDGVPNKAKSDLKLGMVANIDGVIDYTLNTGIASRVLVNRTLIGQVEDVNVSTGEIRLLSQRVTTDATTRFDAALGQLAVGNWVAIHGLSDPSKRTIVATLIERVSDTLAPLSVIRGTVKNHGAGRFSIGDLNVITSLPAQPEDGTFVAVKGTYAISSGNLLATDVQMTREVETHEGVETKLTGYVADFRSYANFTIAGVIVDASHASFEGGRASDIKQDMRVSIEGTIVNGVLIAEEVAFTPVAVVSATSRQSHLEIEGIISAYTSTADFVVKGKHINASQALVTAKPRLLIHNGMKANVKGRLLADDTVLATEVEFSRP